MNLGTASAPLDIQIFAAVLTFVLGTICGSFFNVCIYRVPVKKSIVRPGSHCYTCGSAIAWHDNIPVISYLLLRGQCRQCGSLFSSRYCWIELASGLLFLAILARFGLVPVVIFHCIFASF